eukprot:GHVT01078857.1.p1 GENE.GHVT01078857.1~~GHVT01078857.1.p1  ORF type:complete len:508 (+),score=51.80 GHVT01078857.1:75-1598(+)
MSKKEVATAQELLGNLKSVRSDKIKQSFIGILGQEPKELLAVGQALAGMDSGSEFVSYMKRPKVLQDQEEKLVLYKVLTRLAACPDLVDQFVARQVTKIIADDLWKQADSLKNDESELDAVQAGLEFLLTCSMEMRGDRKPLKRQIFPVISKYLKNDKADTGVLIRAIVIMEKIWPNFELESGVVSNSGLWDCITHMFSSTDYNQTQGEFEVTYPPPSDFTSKLIVVLLCCRALVKKQESGEVKALRGVLQPNADVSEDVMQQGSTEEQRELKSLMAILEFTGAKARVDHLTKQVEELGISCPYFKRCEIILGVVGKNIRSFFNPEFHKCYCESCMSQRGEKELEECGYPPKQTSQPKGWAKFGIKMHEARAETLGVWRNWYRTYHGTQKENVQRYLEAGEIIDDAEEFECHANRVVVSPCLKYGSDDIYANPFGHCEKSTGKMVKCKVTLQVRIKPGCFKELPEQIGASGRGQVFDDNFHNERLEWHTEERGAVMITGLLMNVRDP